MTETSGPVLRNFLPSKFLYLPCQNCQYTEHPAFTTIPSRVGTFMPVPRLILADDHTILVEAFRKLLEPHCEVVGVVSDGRALVETAPRLKPDVIIADI